MSAEANRIAITGLLLSLGCQPQNLDRVFYKLQREIVPSGSLRSIAVHAKAAINLVQGSK